VRDAKKVAARHFTEVEKQHKDDNKGPVPSEIRKVWTQDGDTDHADNCLLSDARFDDGIYAGLPAKSDIDFIVGEGALWRCGLREATTAPTPPTKSRRVRASAQKSSS
jgi:hypothetical protein